MSELLPFYLFTVKTISIHHTPAGPGQMGFIQVKSNIRISAKTAVALKIGFPLRFWKSKTSAVSFCHTHNSVWGVYWQPSILQVDFRLIYKHAPDYSRVVGSVPCWTGTFSGREWTNVKTIKCVQTIHRRETPYTGQETPYMYQETPTWKKPSTDTWI